MTERYGNEVLGPVAEQTSFFCGETNKVLSPLAQHLIGATVAEW